MERTYKHKHVLLQEFTKVLHDHDLMGIAGEENPKAATEYEAEALSILSRFTEGALNLCVDENLRREISVGMVKQAFEFWFSLEAPKGVEKLAFELLELFVNAYPPLEQETAQEVRSEA